MEAGEGVEWDTTYTGIGTAGYIELDGGDATTIVGSPLIPTTGYNTLRIEIDIDRSNDLSSTEFCQVGYKSASTTWIYEDVAGESSGNVRSASFNIPNTDDYNNQASFQLRLRNTAKDPGDICWYDNLKMYGIPQTSSPTPATEVPTSNPTSISPTSKPTTPSPITISPTTTEPTLTPTVTETKNNFTITLEGDTKDLTDTDIEGIVTTALNITSDEILSTDVNDDSISVLISVPTTTALDEDTIQTKIEEQIEQEYEDLDIGVSVEPYTNNRAKESSDKNPFSFLTDDTRVLVLAIIATVLIIVCVSLLIILCRKKKQKNKDKGMEPTRVLSESAHHVNGVSSASGIGEGNGEGFPSNTTEMVNMNMSNSNGDYAYHTNQNKMRFTSVVSDTGAYSDVTYTTPMGVTPVSPPDSPQGISPQIGPQTHTQTMGHFNVDTIGDVNELPVFEDNDDTNEDDELYDDGLRRQPTAGEYLSDGDNEKQGSSESSEDNDGGLYGQGMGVVTPKGGDLNMGNMFNEDQDEDDDVYGQGINTAGE